MFEPGSTISMPQKRVLFVGRKGADVRERQGLLNALNDVGNPQGQSNLAELNADGVFGSKTAMRVKEFQARNRLYVDGVIGPKTDARMDAMWLDALRKFPIPPEE